MSDWQTPGQPSYCPSCGGEMIGGRNGAGNLCVTCGIVAGADKDAYQAHLDYSIELLNLPLIFLGRLRPILVDRLECIPDRESNHDVLGRIVLVECPLIQPMKHAGFDDNESDPFADGLARFVEGDHDALNEMGANERLDEIRRQSDDHTYCFFRICVSSIVSAVISQASPCNRLEGYLSGDLAIESYQFDRFVNQDVADRYINVWRRILARLDSQDHELILRFLSGDIPPTEYDEFELDALKVYRRLDEIAKRESRSIGGH